MISVTFIFDLWPWPFAWTSLLSLVITPENFMIIWWRKHSKKNRQTERWMDRRMNGRADGRTESIHRAAWSRLKIQKAIQCRIITPQQNLLVMHNATWQKEIPWIQKYNLRMRYTIVMNSLKLLQNDSDWPFLCFARYNLKQICMQPLG